MIECQVEYAVSCIRKLIRSGKRSLDAKQSSYEAYQAWLTEAMKSMVFSGGTCSNWYSNARGVVWILWPSNCTKYWWSLRNPNLAAHFDLTQ